MSLALSRASAKVATFPRQARLSSGFTEGTSPPTHSESSPVTSTPSQGGKDSSSGMPDWVWGVIVPLVVGIATSATAAGILLAIYIYCKKSVRRLNSDQNGGPAHQPPEPVRDPGATAVVVTGGPQRSTRHTARHREKEEGRHTSVEERRATVAANPQSTFTSQSEYKHHENTLTAIEDGRREYQVSVKGEQQHTLVVAHVPTTVQQAGTQNFSFLSPQQRLPSSTLPQLATTTQTCPPSLQSPQLSTAYDISTDCSTVSPTSAPVYPQLSVNHSHKDICL